MTRNYENNYLSQKGVLLMLLRVLGRVMLISQSESESDPESDDILQYVKCVTNPMKPT